MSSTAVTTILGLGNNESVSRGVFPQADGTFLAMTFTKSRTFKTSRGAARWICARCAGNPEGGCRDCGVRS